MTKLKDVAPMSILMELSILETGKRIANTAMESKTGQIMPGMRATTNLERSIVLVLLSGLMALLTLVNSITTTSMERECTHGQTTENTRENGEPTRCTAKVPLPGLMAESTSESMPRIRRKATENSSGQMADAIEENG